MPTGLRPAIENFDEVAAHLFHQASAEAAHSPPRRRSGTAEAALAAAVARRGRRRPRHGRRLGDADGDGRGDGDAAWAGAGTPRSPVLATRLRTPVGLLSFFSTFTTFGTPLDITVASLRVEHQFPADAQTAQALQALAREVP